MMHKPIRRLLDLATLPPKGGGPEIVLATLIDPEESRNIHLAYGSLDLPAPDTMLANTGLSVNNFLNRWFAGDQDLDAAARAYGNLLYRHLFEADGISTYWRRAVDSSHGDGLRLEIRLPSGNDAIWNGQRIDLLPFELLHDGNHFLIRKPGWSMLRRNRFVTRDTRLETKHNETACVQVAWANVYRHGDAEIADEWFSAHDIAVERLAQRKPNHVQRLSPLPRATRARLARTLRTHQPHVLVWVGHGLNRGCGLVLHDQDGSDQVLDTGVEVTASEFASDLRAGAVDIALLWSCHGAGGSRPLDVGVAEALLDPSHGNVAAVVASFSAIEPTTAARLSAAVIESLAATDLESALVYARNHADLQERQLDWARPVLFLRTPINAPAPSLPAAAHAEAPPWHLPSSVWPPPLPNPTAHFIDQQSRLPRLLHALRQHQAVVVEGIAGIGKTELALAAAHALQKGGETVLWVDVAGHRDIGLLLQHLGRLVRHEPFETRHQLLAALSGRPTTLVVDHVESLIYSESSVDTLRHLIIDLISLGADFRLLLTSRRDIAKTDFKLSVTLHTYRVEPLNRSEERNLLKAVAGPRLAPLQREDRVLDMLLAGISSRKTRLVAGVLTLAATQVAGVPTEGVNDSSAFDAPSRFRSQEYILAIKEQGLATTIDSIFSVVKNTAPRAEELFDALGLFPSGLDQLLLPRDEHPWIDDALPKLLHHRLVDLFGESRRLVMPPSLREIAHAGQVARSKDSPERGSNVLESIHRNLLNRASSLSERLCTDEHLSALFELQYELEQNLVAMIEWWLSSTFRVYPDNGVRLAFQSLAKIAQYSHRPRESVDQLAILASKINQALPITSTGAHAKLWIASLYKQTESLKESLDWSQNALDDFKSINEISGEAWALKTIGDARLRLGEHDSALDAYDSALSLLRKLDDPIGEANIFLSVGELMSIKGEPERAQRSCEEALGLYRIKGDRLGEANSLSSLGQLRLLRDDLDGAEDALNQGLELFRTIGLRLGEANSLHTLGDLEQRRDDLEAAAKRYKAALTLYRRLGERLGEANTLRSIGALHFREDDVDVAGKRFEDALRVYLEIGEALGSANTIKCIGDVRARTGNLDEAEQLYNQALEQLVRIGDPTGQAYALKSLGDVYSRRSRIYEAEAAYLSALAIHRSTNDSLSEAHTLRALGDLELQKDSIQDAEHMFTAALELYRKVDDALGEANTLLSMGTLKYRTDRLEEARDDLNCALTTYMSVDAPLGQANTLQTLGDVMIRTREHSKAEDSYLSAINIYRDIHADLGIAHTLVSLGQLRQMQGNDNAAAEAYAEALPIFRELDDVVGEANTIQSQGQVLLSQGHIEDAFERTLSALELHTIADNALGVGACHGYLMRIALDAGALAEAIVLGARAYQGFLEISYAHGAAVTLQELGLSLAQSDPTAAAACLLHSEGLLRELYDPMADDIANHIEAIEFEPESLASIRPHAAEITNALFKRAEAGVASGECDPYRLPSATDVDSTVTVVVDPQVVDQDFSFMINSSVASREAQTQEQYPSDVSTDQGGNEVAKDA
jgi:tetratricopeptide (TPR) repeat protein